MQDGHGNDGNNPDDVRVTQREPAPIKAERGVSPALAGVVEQLCSMGSHHETSGLYGTRCSVLPSRDAVVKIVEDLRSVLFPGYFGISELNRESMRFHIGATLSRVMQELYEQVWRGVAFARGGPAPKECVECHSDAGAIVTQFLSRLPTVQKLLAGDVRAAYEGDPAAASPDEAAFCYPGVMAITSYRIAHELYRLGVPLIPRIMTEHAHSITGIDIHPAAVVGERFFIDHGTGVVIGETCRIGDRVRLYQGVTLGAKSFPLDEAGMPVKGVDRHPIVEDDVIIYSGATILGRVTIGSGSVIGGNVWLTRSVPPGSRILQAQSRTDRFQNGGGI